MLLSFLELMYDFAELLMQEGKSIRLDAVLPVPFGQSAGLEILGNAGELSTLSDIPEAIENTSDEHALSECVGKWLYQVPPEPVHFIDAVVAHSKLQGEKEGCPAEYKSVTLHSFLD